MDTVALIKLLGGLTWLVIGGDLLVRGALALARQARIPPIVVGLTVVAFGTSAPELVVAVSATFQGLPEIALGNVIGSNIANVLLVLGLPALIHAMACNQPSASRDASLMVGVSLVFALLCVMGPLGVPHGALMLALLGAYLVLVARTGGLEAEELDVTVDRVLGLPTRKRFVALFFVGGLVMLQFGATLTIDGAVAVATRAGVPESVVALTAIALGTSLPELATTVMAAFQRQSDVAIGNVIGSNVFNLLAIMGITTMVSPDAVPVPEAMLRFDLPVMLGATLTLAAFAWTGRAIGARSGAVLLAAYLAYVVTLFQLRGA